MSSELKDVLKEKNIVFGTNETVKGLKLGKVKKVLLASNCPKSVRDTIAHYAKIANAVIVELDVPDKEIGLLSKKPFGVSVLSC
ncbi:MAG: ribosomal L7Ae/L30e/S12e/Gadd45 family protein [Candidatus Nanoarchaeia archaeon]|nr:ribosomal L7Ae/L30e/S12e/Gadd45 family protein [Candidatus Nanoarchaeia archaeon]